MKRPNRDLLVLVKEDQLNQDAIELELSRLNQLLVDLETVDNLCMAHEVADLNSYRMLLKFQQVNDVIRKKELKPFVFILNKN
jgi:hypothetical protein